MVSRKIYYKILKYLYEGYYYSLNNKGKSIDSTQA